MTTQEFNESVNAEIRRMMENKAKSMDEYDPLLAAYNNGDGDQRAKPYALQVCNAGKMPEDFDSWLKANGDSIPIEDYGGNVRPDRIAANLDQYNERPF